MLLVTRPSFARPDNAFDLTGPKIEMHVTRAGKMLPIADVSNLQPEDRLWIHVNLPDDQAVRGGEVFGELRVGGLGIQACAHKYQFPSQLRKLGIDRDGEATRARRRRD